MDIKDLEIILASGSPRRIEMLRAEGLEPRIIKSSCNESILLPLSPGQYVMSLAFRKGQSVLEKLREEGTEKVDKPLLMISADTVVFKDGRIIGKPRDEEEAFSILSSLRDDVNSVYSGVLLRILGEDLAVKRSLLFSVRTDVRLGFYSDEYIKDYIASGEPMDKAGAYAIQGRFGENVLGIEGPKDNVIGFPLEKIKEILSTVSI